MCILTIKFKSCSTQVNNYWWQSLLIYTLHTNIHTYIIHLMLNTYQADSSARLQAAAAGCLPTDGSPDTKSPMHPVWSEDTLTLCLGMLLLIHSMIGIPNQSIWKAWLQKIHRQEWRLLNNLEFHNRLFNDHWKLLGLRYPRKNKVDLLYYNAILWKVERYLV